MKRPRTARLALLLWIVVFATGFAWAAPEDYEGLPVKSIRFDPAQQPYDQAYLQELVSAVKTGQPLRLADVRAAIERLFRTGRYADVHVDAKQSDGGVTLTFITRGNYFIGRVTVTGVPQPPTEAVLVNATRLELGTLYTPESVKQALENLQDVLRENGLYENKIEPDYQYDPDTQTVNIRFTVTPSEHARYTTPVVTGNPERSVDDIIKTTHWKWRWLLGWKKVTEARTQDGVQRVRRSYQKQDRLEARVALEKMDYLGEVNRAQPTLNIEAGPKIRIQTVGAKISRGKLQQLVPVFEEQSVDRDLLVEGANNIREYLESQGYFRAKVDFDSRMTNGGKQEVIDYRIDRGDRHTVAMVSILGNRYFDTNTIRERMYIRPASFIQFRHGRYSEAFLDHDIDAITSLYRSNGFRDVEVASRVEHGYGGKEKNMAVFLTIREGPQWRVADLQLEGVSAPNREAVLNLLQSQAGQPFSEANVAVDRDNVLDFYFNHGYGRAGFDWSFTPAKEPQEVNVKFTITEGSQHFLRRFLLSGLQTTDAGLVEERLQLQPGEPLSRGRLLDTQRRLYELGIFSRVDMALQDPQGAERNKYVLLDTEEARRYTFTTGFGAEIAKIGGCQTCLDAPAGQAGFSPRALFGVTRRNFLGEGHIISFQSRVSTLQQRGVLSYQAPQFRGSPNWNLLFSGLFDNSRDVRTFSAKRREGSVQVGQKLSKPSTLLYRFSFRRVSVSDLKISPELVPLYSQPARIGMVSTSYVQDRRDDPADARRGIYNTVDLGWAGKALGSQTGFTKAVAHNSTYHPFGFGNRYVLARSLTIGWLQELKAGTQIPLPERFFAGGASSHRGFPENQAGPRDPETGFPLGGNAVFVNQTELRFPVLGDNLTGVLFHDAGNVYSEMRNFSFRVKQRDLKDFDYMVHAIGFGVRYRTPVGPVRLDFAYSINPPRFFGFKGTLDELLRTPGTCSQPQPGQARCVVQQISHFQFHFSLGQAF